MHIILLVPCSSQSLCLPVEKQKTIKPTIRHTEVTTNICSKMNRRWNTALAIAALFCASATLPSANAFQTFHHQSFAASPFLPSSRMEHAVKRESRDGALISSANRASTQLEALPAASAVIATAGGLLTTIGNILVPSSSPMASKILRVTAIFMAGILAASKSMRQKALWPGLTRPKSNKAQSLPGALLLEVPGCTPRLIQPMEVVAIIAR